MRTEYWLMKYDDPEEPIARTVTTSFSNQRLARLAAWFLNKFSNENIFYVIEVKVGDNKIKIKV